MMDRRTFILTAAGTVMAAGLSARAQQPEKVWRVGILNPATLSYASFHEAMRDLGYIEGRNIKYETKDAQGKPDAIPGLARELVALKPDVIVRSAYAPIAEVMRATGTIPIVAVIGDAVGAGFASNLAKPVGNVTGLSFLGRELSAKRIELLKEALPTVSRVAMLNDLNADPTYATETRATARKFNHMRQSITPWCNHKSSESPSLRPQ